MAHALAEKGLDSVRVIDLDLEGSLSSSELNAGGVRATFTQPINIEMSKHTIEFMARHANEFGYRDCGYLWLHTPESITLAQRSQEKWKQAKWETELWDVAKLKNKIPFIDKTSDLAGALFSPRDGLVNPNLVKNFFRTSARARGVVFDDRTIAHSSEISLNGVLIEARKFPMISSEVKIEILSNRFDVNSFESVRYEAKRVVNCAGAWAPKIAKILGYPCPSHPVRRQACIFDGRDVDLSPYGMIVDTSGVYFHPEATNGLAGIANRDEPEGVNFSYDGENFFQELIWPALYERSTKFEKLKHLTGWAGQYEVSPDDCAILGEAIGVPASGRVFEAHSFSGHGVMHSYSAGIALAELITQAKFSTIDAGSLSARRFDGGKLLHETAVI